MLGFTRVIANELGEVVKYCNTLTEVEIDRILENHQEYTISFVEIG